MGGRSRIVALFLFLILASVADGASSVCALAFERIRAVGAAIDEIVKDPVLNPRWVNRATQKIYDRDIRPHVLPLMKKPGREWTPEDGALAAELGQGMKENPFLRDHADVAALAKRHREWLEWETFVEAPLSQLPHGNRAKKGWERLSSKARRQGAVGLDEIRRNPQVGEVKTSFPNRLRFHKFFADGVTYIVAYEVQGKKILLQAIGPHENFYDSLSDFRER